MYYNDRETYVFQGEEDSTTERGKSQMFRIEYENVEINSIWMDEYYNKWYPHIKGVKV